MEKRVIVWILILGTVLSGYAVNSFGQEKEISLKDKKITIHRENESLGTILRDLIERYDVPIGFEESSFDANQFNYRFEVNLPYDNKDCVVLDSDGRKTKCEQKVFNAKDVKFTIIVENEPLQIVLDQIVERMRHYKWEINDGVVNILPVMGRDKRFEELLNVKIKRFENKNYLGVRAKKIEFIRYNIFSLPEIREFLQSNNLKFSSTGSISPNESRELSDDLIFSDLTLKDLLNKITRFKRGGWALKINDYVNDNRNDVVDIDI